MNQIQKNIEHCIKFYYHEKFESAKNVNNTEIENFKRDYEKCMNTYKDDNIEFNINDAFVAHDNNDDNSHRVTPLTWAIIHNCVPLVKVLIEYCNAQVDVVYLNDENGFTDTHLQSSLYIALTNDKYVIDHKLDMINYLIHADSDIHVGWNSKNDTCLKYCIRNKLNKTLDYIMRLNNQKHNVYKQCYNGYTIVHYVIFNNYFKENDSEEIFSLLKEGYYLGMFVDLTHQLFINKERRVDKKSHISGDYFCRLMDRVKPIEMNNLDKISLINAYELASIMMEEIYDQVKCSQKIVELESEKNITIEYIPSNNTNFPYHSKLVQILKTEEQNRNNDEVIKNLFICERTCMSSNHCRYSSIFMDLLIKVYRKTSEIDLMYLGLEICISRKMTDLEYFIDILFTLYKETRDKYTLFQIMNTHYLEQIKDIDAKYGEMIIYIYVVLIYDFLCLLDYDQYMKILFCRHIKTFRLSNGNSILHCLLSKNWRKNIERKYNIQFLDNDILLNLLEFLFTKMKIDLRCIISTQEIDLYNYAIMQDRQDIAQILTENYKFNNTYNTTAEKNIWRKKRKI